MTSQETKDRTVSVTSDNSNCNTLPAANPTSPLSRPSRPSGKVHNFGKRSNSIKRNPNAPVTARGWLYKKVCHAALIYTTISILAPGVRCISSLPARCEGLCVSETRGWVL
ncbi:pleckstrin homology domain-containing family A member 5-like isoform X2 [Eleutherodactylus coqui]